MQILINQEINKDWGSTKVSLGSVKLGKIDSSVGGFSWGGQTKISP